MTNRSLFAVFLLVSFLAAASCHSSGSNGKPTTNVVSVVDRVSGTPGAGIDIVVCDSAGDVVEHLTTAEDGTVAVAVPPNGYVSAYAATQFSAADLRFDGRSIAAPPKGAALTFAFDLLPGASGGFYDFATYAITLTGAPAGATGAQISGPDGATITNTTATGGLVQTFAPDGVSGTFVAVATTNGRLMPAWGTATATPVPNGTSVVTIPLSQTAMDSFAVSASGLTMADPPSETGATNWQLAISQFIPPFSVGVSDQIAGTTDTVSATLNVPAMGSSTAALALVLDYWCGAQSGCTSILETGGFVPLGSPVSFDLSTLAHPVATPGFVQRTDPLRPAIGWFDAPASAPLGACSTATFFWSNPGSSNLFQLLLPPERTTARLPSVPPELGFFAPDQNSVFSPGGTTLTRVADPALAGYADCVSIGVGAGGHTEGIAIY